MRSHAPVLEKSRAASAVSFAAVPGEVSALASDGRHVVAGVIGAATHVFDRARRALLCTLPVLGAAVALLDGDTVYLVAEGVVARYGLADGLVRACPRIPDTQGLRFWTAEGARGLVAGGRFSELETYDAEHRPLARFGLRRRLHAFDVHGTTVATAYAGAHGRAGPVRLFDCLTGKKLRAAPDGHAGPIFAVQLDAVGLVTASLDGTVRAYDTAHRFVRATTLPDGEHLIGLRPDPSDARVLHGIAPTAVLRLDRETLEVLERTTVAAGPRGAFGVDALGRLVGVAGSIESLDPLPTVPAPSAVPDVRAMYEREGWFDKDEQGWCCVMVNVSQEERRVAVRTWFDANGSTRSDDTRRGAIERIEGDIVHLAMDDGGALRFDATKRRLV